MLINTNVSRLPWLDGWRGLAIIMVLVSHFAFRGHSWTGGFGVLMFFVLSGLLISELLFIKQVHLSDFFFRRVTRIIPTFWLYVLALAAVNNYVFSLPNKVTVGELMATLAFLRTYLPSDDSIWLAHWPIGHVWSLNIEEHSYIFLAAGAYACRKSTKRWVAPAFLLASAAAAFTIGLYYSTYPPAGASPWYLRSECASFGLITAAALRLIRHHHSSWVVVPMLPLIAFALGTIAFVISPAYFLNGFIAPLCLAFSLVYLDRAPVFLRGLLSAKWLGYFGISSFSLYIWQQPFFALMGKYNLHPVIAFTGAIATGVLSFYCYENRIRIKLNRAWENSKGRLVKRMGTGLPVLPPTRSRSSAPCENVQE